LDGGLKATKQVDEEAFPSLEASTKLNMLATSRLKELVDKASPAEKAAVSTLLGSIS